MNETEQIAVPTPPTAAAQVPQVAFTPIVDETIDDVSQSTREFINKHYKKQVAWGVAAGVVFDVIVAFFLIKNINSGEKFDPRSFFILLTPVFAYGLFYASIANKIRHQFYQQFAQANGYSYELNGSVPNLNGAIFQIGHSQKTADTVFGQHQGHPIWLFDYSYVTGQGKSSQTHEATVFKIDQRQLLPPLLLIADSQIYGGLKPLFQGAEHLALEGDFNKFFGLYAEKRFETEALQIFSPDFMAKMRDQWRQFSIDFSDTSIYIYSNKWITTKIELQNMYALAEYLMSHFQPLLDRMQGDIKAMEEEAAKFN